MAQEKSRKENTVSLTVIRRLPRYYRFLGELEKSGCTRISSRELSEKMGLTASQIRQDLNCFGGFGQQGYGYNVPALREEVGKILGLDQKLDAILIGVGNLGHAIGTHMDFESKGFHLLALFDNNPNVIGTEFNHRRVESIENLESFCLAHKPSVAILCIPKDAAKALAEQLIALGIRGFWNFSHYDLSLEHEGIVVENVHLGDSLMSLSYMVNQKLK
ncbi:MAG: redox-sensing transcriptional repressor Rex [Oscillospiraceae bacterium]|nr:redox-sensing transcriptional repressor Rex [Oscillospiraceae bacterium]